MHKFPAILNFLFLKIKERGLEDQCVSFFPCHSGPQFSKEMYFNGVGKYSLEYFYFMILISSFFNIL